LLSNFGLVRPILLKYKTEYKTGTTRAEYKYEDFYMCSSGTALHMLLLVPCAVEHIEYAQRTMMPTQILLVTMITSTWKKCFKIQATVTQHKPQR
jgi:hypothetical protein